MKRIGALSGMRWMVLLLVFLIGYTADVAVAHHVVDGVADTDSLWFEIFPEADPDPPWLELNPLEYVPLAVGNRWTYEHSYYNDAYWISDDPNPEKLEPTEIPGYPHGQGNPIPPDSLRYVYDKPLTIEITHTEVIDGLEYFVFSDADYTWPPLPALFWDGKKVRLSDEGFLVFRWNGQDVPVYDFDHHHLDEHWARREPKNSYRFTLPGESGTIKVKIKRSRSESELSTESSGPESQYSVVTFYYSQDFSLLSSYCSFLSGYGIGQVYTEALFLEGVVIYQNSLTPISANIDGEEILYPMHGPYYGGPYYPPSVAYFGTEFFDSLFPDTTTSVQPTSWGRLKQLFLGRSSPSQDPP